MAMSMIKISENLYIREIKTGRYYIARIFKNGKRYERSLGNTKHVSLSEAKTQVADLVAQASSQQKTEKNKSGTLNDVYEQMKSDIFRAGKFKIHPTEGVSTREKSIDGCFKKHILPVIGNIKLNDIGLDDVRAVVDRIYFSHPSVGVEAIRLLEKAIGWACVNSYRDSRLANPAVWRNNLELIYPRKERIQKTKHREQPTIDDLRKIVSVCLQERSAKCGAILLCIATCVRVSEVLSADCGEFCCGKWTVPSAHRKVDDGDECVIPLSSLALESLDMGDKESVIFKTIHKNVISRNALINKIRKITGSDSVTMHGIRGAFRTWASESGVNFDVAEKILDHSLGNTTQRAYNRPTFYDERKKVLQEWADMLTE